MSRIVPSRLIEKEKEKEKEKKGYIELTSG
jgi:hypothetical protein